MYGKGGGGGATASIAGGSAQKVSDQSFTQGMAMMQQAQLNKAQIENIEAKKQKVSKFLYPISISATGSAAQSYFLATYPCSIGGCQLTFGQLSSDPAQDGYYYALMVVRQGNPTPTLNITTATNPLVAPERDVFLQGFWTPGQANVISTKTRRVLQQGDELVLIVETNNANEVVVGTVQFFSFV